MMSDHSPKITWDWGTAYDLFASLNVLHHPGQYGLRGSWAAGVRSRLPPMQRIILEQAQTVLINNPLAWVSVIPNPKDADTVLWSISRIPPVERLPTLASHAHASPEVWELLGGVMARRAWELPDLERLQNLHHAERGHAKGEELVTSLNWWSHPEEFGERYLAALRTYVSVFFAEEEQRIRPFLQQAFTQAKERASGRGLSELWVELSQGDEISSLEEAEVVTFAPSYWITPHMRSDSLVKNHWVVLFGARSAEVSLIPGEAVPAAMLNALKALSDPTRLKILRYLTDTPQTPTQLAIQLRLRTPTVIHHLNALKLAGLVYVSVEENDERRYAIRQSEVENTLSGIQNYLSFKGRN